MYMTHYSMCCEIFVLLADIVGREWHGHSAVPEYTDLLMPANSRVKVVMASDSGDVGITPHLDDECVYVARCCPGLLVSDDGKRASCNKLPSHEHPCAECNT